MSYGLNENLKRAIQLVVGNVEKVVEKKQHLEKKNSFKRKFIFNLMQPIENR